MTAFDSYFLKKHKPLQYLLATLCICILSAQIVLDCTTRKPVLCINAVIFFCSNCLHSKGQLGVLLAAAKAGVLTKPLMCQVLPNLYHHITADRRRQSLRRSLSAMQTFRQGA